MRKFIFIDRWCYTMPDYVPAEDGNIILISKKSFGPLEVYEWGLDNNNNPYERYEWLEDDFYEGYKYCKTITREELQEITTPDCRVEKFEFYGGKEYGLYE